MTYQQYHTVNIADRYSVHFAHFYYEDDPIPEACPWVEDGVRYSGWAFRLNDWPGLMVHRSSQFDLARGFSYTERKGDMKASDFGLFAHLCEEVAAANDGRGTSTVEMTTQAWKLAVERGICIPARDPAQVEDAVADASRRARRRRRRRAHP